ncbi:hypothetical protein [Polaribacter sp.]|uniref:hypothetical protein n=1 Tax=Polaribacter sp. TaxID=1920175 RepID=UPI003EF44D81
MKYFIIVLFFSISVSSFAQKIKKGGVIYEVKKEKIFLNGENITKTLSFDEMQAIFKEAFLVYEKKEEIEKLEKAQKKAYKISKKEERKAEKAQEKAEDELREKLKQEKKIKKADGKLKKTIAKRDRLKKKGALSPLDEADWLKKIEKLKSKLEKSKKK